MAKQPKTKQASPLRYGEKKLLLRKALLLLGLLLFLSFIASTLFGDSGILVNMRVKTEYDNMVAERDRLFQENQRLRNEIKALKYSKRKIEAIGRKEFNFGRPGEVVFYFPPDNQATIFKSVVPKTDSQNRDTR